MLIAFADLPEDMRSEILKLVKWCENSNRKEGERARTAKSKTQYDYAARQFLSLCQDIERIRVVSKVGSPLKLPEVTSELAFPVVNMNGSSAKSLIDALVTALDAVRKAEHLLRAVHPHGRDYQTAPKERYDKAMWQHEARANALARIVMELEQTALDIQRQDEERNGR